MYYHDANAALLVYDVTNPASFKSLEFWLTELDSKIAKEGLILVLVGNKCDLTQQKCVSVIEAGKFAKGNNMGFFETSALTGLGVHDLFTYIGETLLEKKAKQTKENSSPLKSP